VGLQQDFLGTIGMKPDVTTGQYKEELESVIYPSAWCRVHLKLEDFGQPNPDDLIALEYIPLSAHVVLNSFDVADTFRVKIDFEEFPLDPRIIEGATCEIFMASAGSLDADFWLKQDNEFFRSHCVMNGLIDHIKGGLGSEGRITELKGRDYTAYFLDSKVEAKPISYHSPEGEKLTFVEVIEAILGQYEGRTAAITIRDKDDIENIYPHDYKKGADDKQTGKRKKKKDETVWEAVRDIAIEAGHIIYVDLDEIVVRKPRTLYVDAPQDRSRWLLYTLGHDVEDFQSERQMGRKQGIRVRCTSFIDQDHERLVAIYPPKGFTKAEIAAKKVASDAGAASSGDSGGTGSNSAKSLTFQSYVFRNIKTQEHLNEIARQLYTLVCHHELEGSFTTSEMTDSNGIEVWGIRYGDPITFAVSESLESIISLSMAEQIERLIDYGYGVVAARALALSVEQAGVPFYIHSITHNYDSEDETGYSMDVEIRSRRQVDLTKSNEPGEAVEVEE
jgi:hypothetical protein